MVNKNKKVTFEFYEVMSKDNDNPDDVWMPFSLKRLATKIEDAHFEFPLRIDESNHYLPFLNKANYNTSSNFQYFHITKERPIGPGIGNRTETNIHSVPLKNSEFIAEDMSLLYDENINVLMIQRNNFCTTPTKIADLFSDIENEISNSNIKIELRIILQSNVLERLHDKEVLTKIDISTSDFNSINRSGIFNFGGALSDSVEDGINFELTLSVGNNKKKKLPEILHQIIDYIPTDNNLKKLKLSAGKKDADNKNFDIEPFDLLHGKIQRYRTFNLGDKDENNHLRDDVVRTDMEQIFSSADLRREINATITRTNTY